MKKEYRIFCKCIEDIIKFLECTACPHYDRHAKEFCTYEEPQNESAIEYESNEK